MVSVTFRMGTDRLNVQLLIVVPDDTVSRSTSNPFEVTNSARARLTNPL